MKRWFTILLAVVLCLTLVACGASSTGSSSAVKATLTASQWVNIYSGNQLVLHSDNSMEIGSYTGSWSFDEMVLTINYRNDYHEIEKCYDVVEEADYTLLRSRQEGKSDGEVTSFDIEELYSEDIANRKIAEISHKLGDTVSTDIIDFTLSSATFSYYASASSTSFAEPIESDDGGIFATNKGHTFVIMECKITNTDRARMDVGGDWGWDWRVVYGGGGFPLRSYNLNNPDGDYYLDLGYSTINGAPYSMANYIMDAGETIDVRVLGQVNMEPENLTDGFELVIELPTSSGEGEKFIYAIE